MISVDSAAFAAGFVVQTATDPEFVMDWCGRWFSALEHFANLTAAEFADRVAAN